jgi:hypothetical protein
MVAHNPSHLVTDCWSSLNGCCCTQDLSTLLSGCPAKLHTAFMQTAATLAEQQQAQKPTYLQQQLILAQQGYTDLNSSQMQLLLQQQQGQRYSVVPITALPMLLAAAVPQWCGADVGYAALQIRCHLNIICDFTLDTPVAADATNKDRSGSDGGLAQEPGSLQQQQQQQRQQQDDGCGCANTVDPPCDLMYAELASTILAAAATEAAVADQQLPPAIQGLLVDFTAELSSKPELQAKLQEAFARAAGSFVPATVAAVNSSGSSAGSCVQQDRLGHVPRVAAAGVPVVKAVKLLCKQLVGPTGLSDIRLLAWLTALVRQQHIANQGAAHATPAAAAAAGAEGQQLPELQTTGLQAAATAEVAAAVIMCGQLLHILGQLVGKLTGHDHDTSAGAAAAAVAAGLLPAGNSGSGDGFGLGLHGWQLSAGDSEDGFGPAELAGSNSVTWNASHSAQSDFQGQQKQQQHFNSLPQSRTCFSGLCDLETQGSPDSHSNSHSSSAEHQPRSDSREDYYQWTRGRRRARQNYRSSSGASSEGGYGHSTGWGQAGGNNTWQPLQSSNSTSAETARGSHRSSSSSKAELDTETAAVHAAFGLSDAPDLGHGGSSVGRAAHRPLSPESSFGADVWSIVAAATAAADGGVHQYSTGAQYVRCSVLLGQQAVVLPGKPQLRLMHQSTWPGSGGSNGSSGGSSGGSNGSSSGGSSGGSCGRRFLSASCSTICRSRLSCLSLPGTSIGGNGGDLSLAAAAAAVGGCTSSRSSSKSTTVSSSTTNNSGTSALKPTSRHEACTAAQYVPAARRSGRLVALQQSLQMPEQECNAQQQAWRAEMILQHQPWEGAVSPVAVCANAAFGSDDRGARTVIDRWASHTRRSSSDGVAKAVDILKISSGSCRSSKLSEDADV